MSVVNIQEAKSNLSRLVKAVETWAEPEIIIARNGRPAARVVPIAAARPTKRIGIAKGKFVVFDDIDFDNALIERLFTGEEK